MQMRSVYFPNSADDDMLAGAGRCGGRQERSRKKSIRIAGAYFRHFFPRPRMPISLDHTQRYPRARNKIKKKQELPLFPHSADLYGSWSCGPLDASTHP